MHAWAEKENEKHIIESIEHGDSMVGWMVNYMHAYLLKCDFSFTDGREPSQQQFHKHNSKWIQSMPYVIRSNRKIEIKNEITPVCMYICMYSTYLLYRHEDWLSTCTSTKKNTATAEDPAPRIEAGSEKAGYIQASHSKENKRQSPSRARRRHFSWARQFGPAIDAVRHISSSENGLISYWRLPLEGIVQVSQKYG